MKAKAFVRFFDETLLELGREVRWSYLPPLMVYLAAGVSGLTAREMDVLAAFHARHDGLTESLLREAFDQAASPTIPEVLFQLQSLLHERND